MKILKRHFFGFWLFLAIIFHGLGTKALDRSEVFNSVSPVAIWYLFRYVILELFFYVSIAYGVALIPLSHSITVTKFNSFIRVYHMPLPPGFHHTVQGCMSHIILVFLDLPVDKHFSKACLEFIIRITAYATIAWSYLSILIIACDKAISSHYSIISLENRGFAVHGRKSGWATFVNVFLVKAKNFVAWVSMAASKIRWIAVEIPWRWRIFMDGEKAAAGVRENSVLLKMDKILKGNKELIKFVAGTAATILFQNYYIKLNSWENLVPFLYLALAWLCNVTMHLVDDDFGILNFLLSNVILGSAVNISQLKLITWVAFGACIVLFMLRVKLQSLTQVTEGDNTFIVWRQQLQAQQDDSNSSV